MVGEIHVNDQPQCPDRDTTGATTLTLLGFASDWVLPYGENLPRALSVLSQHSKTNGLLWDVRERQASTYAQNGYCI